MGSQSGYDDQYDWQACDAGPKSTANDMKGLLSTDVLEDSLKPTDTHRNAHEAPWPPISSSEIDSKPLEEGQDYETWIRTMNRGTTCSTFETPCSGTSSPSTSKESLAELPALLDILACTEIRCEAQPKGDSRRGNLLRHHRLIHCSSSHAVPCGRPGCDKIFMWKDARLKHLRKYHPNRNPD
ncbi:hypothetical protein BDV96DRAFT_22002 [Lophiotrema nucula]|uniref:C2H2-type domain-containing protein n=1 Tax=Lophiotrema nucula TaxID=690887 RepID=A0A6A5ZFW1_9PLEO|nr:hypothetical protein BDV96DRAFT_22002 [Lophiotrema nucula]